MMQAKMVGTPNLAMVGIWVFHIVPKYYNQKGEKGKEKKKKVSWTKCYYIINV